MCKRCADQIRQQGLRSSDLESMPYKVVRWGCLTPGCKSVVLVKDYGIDPYYFHPVIVHYWKNGAWRGGWFDASDHWRACGRCWSAIKKAESFPPDSLVLRHNRTPEILLSRITQLPTK